MNGTGEIRDHEGTAFLCHPDQGTNPPIRATQPVEGAQVNAIRTAIANNLPELAIEFPVGRLCVRYAQQTVQSQKKILKSLERAATFKKNRDAFLRARQQASTGDLKVASR